MDRQQKQQPLGMIYTRVRKDTGNKFQAGYLNINGEQVPVVLNRAKSLDKNGEPFWVLFPNNGAATEGKKNNVKSVKSKVIESVADEVIDEADPF